ncbi:MAG: 50S ribosomal protein L17 [Nitrospiraceae bacterium]|nr:MAG: 50S ribosomal protein L17 [Nitrospiraceae bacterium]
MRHRVAGKSFGRTANQRKALFRGLVTSLFDHLKIETTAAKAKETKRLAEKMITLGKKGDIHSRRLALSRIPNKKVVTKLFTEIAPHIDRSSGYLRVVKSRFRAGDNSDMAILEFVDYDVLKEARGDKKGEKKEDKKKAADKPEKKEKREKNAKAVKKEDVKEEKAENTEDAVEQAKEKK